MALEIVIENEKAINFRDSVFVTGFHGVGWTGYIAIRHMVKVIDPKERIGYMIGEKIPDVISLEDDQVLLPYEFYKHNQLVIFQPPFQPFLTEQHEMIRTLAQWIVKSGFKEAVLFGGLDIRFREGTEELRIVPTRAIVDKAKQLNYGFLERGLLIRGPLALLLAHLEILNYPAVVVLPYAKPDRPDPVAASIAINYLNKQYNLEISTSQLKTDAELIENEIDEILRQERERTQQEPRDMYI